MESAQFYKRPARNKQKHVVFPIPEGSDQDELSNSDEEFSPVASVNEECIDSTESSTDEENVTPTPAEKERSARPIIWKTIRTGTSAREIPKFQGDIQSCISIQTPIQYFRYFFEDNTLDFIVEQSNLFAVQVNPDSPLKLTRQELEQFLGTVMYMSVINFPRTRMYWNSFTRIPHISEYFSRDRWEKIKSCLHFNDNTNMPEHNDRNKDRLFKIRPLIECLLLKFQSFPKPQMLRIDEQIVPFKGRSSLKQYIPSKPYKWGYKIFVLSDSTGLVHNFEIYTGKIEPLANSIDLGASSNIVMRLAEIIPNHNCHCLVFDNWFTSLKLLSALHDKGIYSLGTVRSNRLGNCKIVSDGELKKRGRGSYEEKEATIQGAEIRVLKWHDNKCVTLAGTVGSGHTAQNVRRYDRKQKEYVEVSCPQMVKMYNKHMGGVDLLDGLISYYRTEIRSKKFYHRLFFHFIDMVIVNCWLLYCRDCQSFDVPAKKRIDLLEFRTQVAESLCMQGKNLNSQKRGRPRSESVDSLFAEKKRKGSCKPIPNESVRNDGYGHWPIIFDRQRCKNPACQRKSIIKCKKCDIHLCLNINGNCFYDFHTK